MVANSDKTTASKKAGKYIPPGFKKGQSGNPSGRPKMPEELKAKLREGANKAVKYWLNHLTRRDITK